VVAKGTSLLLAKESRRRPRMKAFPCKKKEKKNYCIAVKGAPRA
jgi:hypothetical protein